MSFAEIKDKLFKVDTNSSGRDKKMLMLMPVLFIVLIFVITRALKQPASSSAAVEAANRAADVNFTKINWPVPDVYPANLRDPMLPWSSASGEDKTGNVVVTGIIYSKDKPAVLVDGKIVRVGDKVAGATVVKINKDSVEFEMDDKTWTQEVQQ